jgi:putative nucleotidyltransferase with HDIG domain
MTPKPTALELLEQAPSNEVWLENALVVGRDYLQQGDLSSAALELVENTVSRARGLASPRLAGALITLGLFGWRRGDGLSAISHLAEAGEVEEQSPDPHTRLRLLTAQGAVLHGLGDLHTAAKRYGEALSLARSLQDTAGEARALNNLALIEQQLEHYPESLVLFQQTLERREEVDDEIGLCRTHIAVIGLYLSWLEQPGNLETISLLKQALEHTGVAQHLALKLNNPFLCGMCAYHTARVQVFAGDYSHARGQVELAFSFARTLESADFMANAQEALGLLEQAQGRFDLALEAYGQALTGFQDLKQRDQMIGLHRRLSKLYRLTGRFDLALEHTEAAHLLDVQVRSEAAQKQMEVLTTRRQLEEAKLRGELERLRGEELEKLVGERTAALEAAQQEMLERLAVAAEFRDTDTGEHTKRVGERAAAVARVLGWDTQTVEILRNAARLHDLGKIAVSDTILHKPGKLTLEEFETIKTHTTVGAKMLEHTTSRLLQMAGVICLSHHEKWDGTGYPQGLAGETIPLEGRIVAVVDVLDALTSSRPYKRAWTLDEALEEIRAQSGRHFDPQVVEALFVVLKSRAMSDE